MVGDRDGDGLAVRWEPTPAADATSVKEVRLPSLPQISPPPTIPPPPIPPPLPLQLQRPYSRSMSSLPPEPFMIMRSKALNRRFVKLSPYLSCLVLNNADWCQSVISKVYVNHLVGSDNKKSSTTKTKKLSIPLEQLLKRIIICFWYATI